MKMPWDELEGPAKLLAICAAVFFVAAGLCGMQAAMVMGSRANTLGDLLIPLGIVEIAAMIGSGTVAVFAVFFIILRAIFPSKETQSLFPRDKDDNDKQP